MFVENLNPDTKIWSLLVPLAARLTELTSLPHTYRCRNRIQLAAVSSYPGDMLLSVRIMNSRWLIDTYCTFKKWDLYLCI